jgi:hypothetical protein
VLARCHGGGCPRHSWRAKTTATTRRCRHRRCRRKVKLLHNINVTGRLARHPLRPGATVTVVVGKAGYASKVLTLTVLRDRAPSFKLACTLPGSAPFGC